MTTSRLYASKEVHGGFTSYDGFCFTRQCAVFTYFLFYGRYSLSATIESGSDSDSGYFNIPVLGSVNATVGSTSLGYQDIIDIIDDSDNFYSNPDFLGRLKDKNNLNVNVSTEILSAGWYKGKNFWSFNVGVRADIGASLTRSMFTF